MFLFPLGSSASPFAEGQVVRAYRARLRAQKYRPVGVNGALFGCEGLVKTPHPESGHMPSICATDFDVALPAFDRPATPFL